MLAKVLIIIAIVVVLACLYTTFNDTEVSTESPRSVPTKLKPPTAPYSSDKDTIEAIINNSMYKQFLNKELTMTGTECNGYRMQDRTQSDDVLQGFNPDTLKDLKTKLVKVHKEIGNIPQTENAIGSTVYTYTDMVFGNGAEQLIASIFHYHSIANRDGRYVYMYAKRRLPAVVYFALDEYNIRLTDTIELADLEYISVVDELEGMPASGFAVTNLPRIYDCRYVWPQYTQDRSISAIMRNLPTMGKDDIMVFDMNTSHGLTGAKLGYAFINTDTRSALLRATSLTTSSTLGMSCAIDIAKLYIEDTPSIASGAKKILRYRFIKMKEVLGDRLSNVQGGFAYVIGVTASEWRQVGVNVLQEANDTDSSVSLMVDDFDGLREAAKQL